MKTLLYANRAEPKSISVISILLLAAVGIGGVISLLRKIFGSHLTNAMLIAYYLLFIPQYTLRIASPIFLLL